VRRTTLTVLRLPFTAVKAVIGVLLTLPQLPTLMREQDRLRGELTRRELELAQLREQLRQAGAAQALMALAPPEGPGVVARAIGRSTIPTQHTILLDQGSRQGLVLGGVVVDANGVVGRVVEVHPATSLVMLLTDPDSRVAGLVERSRETGLLVGSARHRCDFIYLAADADVAIGDRIVTAGLDGPFPKGLLLGTVTAVTRDETSGSAQATVIPAAQLGRLEEVLCVPPARALATVAAEPPSKRRPAEGEPP
jgi:rod shape-determining protein MreC